MTATCSKCGKAFGSERGLRQHYTAKHSRFRCDPCKRRFPDQRALDAHNRAKHAHDRMKPSALCGGGAAAGGSLETVPAAVREFPEEVADA